MQGGGHDKLKQERNEARKKKNQSSKKKKEGMTKEERKAQKRNDCQKMTESEGKGLN